MTIVQHKNIDNSQLHEPKDISLAVANKVYVSNGLGSGSWEYATAQGATTFYNESTPFSILSPNAYVKVAPTTTPQTSPIEFTEGTDCSLTYVGLKQRVAFIYADLTIADSASIGRNITVAIYRNGVILPFTGVSQIVAGVPTYRQGMHVSVKTSAVAGDKFEIYMKTGNAGTMALYGLQFVAQAVL
jgi:hypothetical protein